LGRDALMDIKVKPRVDLVGQKFGRLTVVQQGPDYVHRAKRYSRWLCDCSCGEVRLVRTKSLSLGESTSCGCARTERVRKLNLSHGQCGTATYRTWKAMLSRCYNPNVVNFSHYGGRGIYVTKPWRKSFAAFLADVGPRPTKDHELDRINNNGPYRKSNVRWLPKKLHRRRRHQRRLT
jgi:hypothetical protein